MRLTLFLLSVLVASCSLASRDRNNKRYKVVCYWGSWSFYNKLVSSHPFGVENCNCLLNQFRAEDANPNICTHMIYGFAKLGDDNTITPFDPDLDLGDKDWNSGLPYGQGMYRRFNHLKKVNPHLTTLIAIGGWNEGSDKYSRMVSNPSSRSVFVNSAVKFLQEHGFDGLDLDWEYPAQSALSEEDRTPGNPADKRNFVALVRELHSAFQPHGFILTAAVSAGKNGIDIGYNVPELNAYLDFMNIMSYDFHVGKEDKVAHQSPLHPRSQDSEVNQQLTVEYAVDYWLRLGANPSKLVLGMPLYGRGFYLANPGQHGIGASANGDGGMPTYNEICHFLKSHEWTVYRDHVQKVPYIVSQNRRLWIGYDDEQSLRDKLTFLKSKGLGGGMIWSLDSDDFFGKCGHGKFPLLKTISRDLNGIDGPDVDIPETHVTSTPGDGGPVTSPPHTTIAPPTNKPGDTFVCPGAGYYGDPKSNAIFHHCVSDGRGGYLDYVGHCPAGTTFDEQAKVCVS